MCQLILSLSSVWFGLDLYKIESYSRQSWTNPNTGIVKLENLFFLHKANAKYAELDHMFSSFAKHVNITQNIYIIYNAYLIFLLKSFDGNVKKSRMIV